MFYDYFSRLCARKGVSTSRAAEDINLSRSTVSKWKNGSTPSGSTLQKLSEYFGIPADYLLRGEEPFTETQPDLTFNDFTYALHNETKELSPENKQRLLEFARLFRAEQEKETKEK
ncbi:helix-turn-helix domain-containing protein [Anaeromassilibacillus sp. An200]|uniref:helix-turn-helix domain-containing protein n=1 Tax=Anaeromassilibacillus sp. An200 TaxID=1965587 RepID=UPI0013A6714D|nr:helix-turn-helix domain-containing protein [Anaeromassilibacillus sp. An200]